VKPFLVGLFVLVAIGLVVSLVPVSAKESKEKGTVEGTVLSAETNQPIAGVSLEFQRRFPKKPSVTLRRATDAAGKFTASLPVGAYDCLIRKDGFGARTESVEVKAGETAQMPVPLNREARIAGRIVDSAGKPLAGLAVSFGKKATAVTDAAGRFSVAALDAGWYELRVDSPTWVVEKQVSLSVAAGEKKDVGNVTLRRAGSVTLLLTSADRRAARFLSGIEVTLSGASVYRYGKTNSKGTIAFAKLPPGSYTIESSDERLTESKATAEVAEGKSASVRMPVALRPPSLSLDDSGRVILPDKAVPVSLRGLWVDRTRLALYAVDEARLMDGTVDPDRPETIPTDALKPVREQDITLKKARMTVYRNASLKLDPLPPGLYMLEAVGAGAKGRTTFLVTRFGLVAKASRAGTLLFAADLLDGRARRGAEIRVVPVAGGSTPEFIGTTDASGLLSLGDRPGKVRVVGRSDGNLAILNLAREETAAAGAPLKGYLYTERPAYRPGQTVYFKGVLRKTVGEGYALPQSGKVRVVATDSGEQTLFEKEYQLSSTGSINGEFAIPGQPPLGEYTLKAETGGHERQTSFKVLEYRKPEFEVSTSVPAKFYVGGDPVPVTVTARYYFGAPVADAKVSYRIYSRPYYRFDDEGGPGDDGDDEDSPSYGYADFVGEGEAVTDASGKALLSLATQTNDSARAYSVEVDVTDTAGREVSSTAGFTVTPSLIALSVRPLSYLASPGRPIDMKATAATWEGKPLRTNLDISVEEQVYDKKTHISSFRKVDDMRVTTDETGRAIFSRVFPRPGYWRVTATTLDERGLKAVAQGWIWVWKEGFAWDSSYRELSVEFDKKSYRPGENARLIVKSPAPNASLLLTVEGREIYSSQVVPLTGAVQVVELPVTAEHAPYVFVSTVLIDGGRFYSRTKTLRVDSKPDLLDLKVAAEKPVYAPGDTVRLSVSAAGSGGAPREAELSLAVVDEALYAVAPERRADIYKFFRGTREHLVTTLNSFPRVYLGGAPKAAAAAPADDQLRGIKVRKVFKDTAFWLPVLRTGSDGRASAEFALPDNLTTWRATAVAHNDRSEFGSGRGTFIARLDVMARLQPPRFLTAGDQVRIPGVITNMTDGERLVNGIFETGGVSLLGEDRFSGTVAPGGTLRRDMEVKAGAPGEALLRMRALAGDRGDAMELLLPVFPRGMKRVSQGNIVLREGEGETTVSFPSEAMGDQASLSVKVSPTLAASLNESLAELIDFPYGCVEQTMSRFLPAVQVKHLLGSDRFSLVPEIAGKLERVLDEGLRRLYDFQHEDGGWGWWKDDATDAQMTAHVVYGLAMARKAGIPVRDDSFDKGVQALSGRMDTAGADDLPALYRAYTLAGKTGDGVEKRVEAAWSRLPASGRVQYVEALLNAGRNERAKRLLESVKKQVKREGSAAYLKDEDADSWWYSWRWSGSAVETTAMLLENQLAVDPGDPIASQLAEFLVRKRSGRWWNTTRGTATVVTALARYTAATGEMDASYTARLSLNGRELERYVVEKGKLVQGRAGLPVPGSGLTRGENRINLVKEGSGGALYLSANLDYFVPPERASQSPGLSVERKMYRLVPRKDGSEWRMEYQPLKPGELLSPGDEVEVRLTVDNREDMNFVIIEDRLPSGFEVRETKNDARFAGYSSYWDWYAHQERHDERMSFFLDLLPAGRHEFRYVIYPELEGDVLALPASVWPMYVPSLRSESLPWQVRVNRKQ
jgi:uncharacterized protein YfaS (alpha-2-macroglobulin family)